MNLTSNFRLIIPFLLITFLYNCSNDSSDSNTNDIATTKLLAIDGVGSRLRIVELNPLTGDLVSEFHKFEVMQASVDFDFSYFKPTNELFVKRNVFEGGFDSQIIKIDIDTKISHFISIDVNSKIIASKDKLFGFNRTVDGNSLTIDLFEIDSENGSKIKLLETFETLENAPDNNKTGVTNLYYSHKTNEIIIPRRKEFYIDSIDELIKINAYTGAKKVSSIEHYEAITISNKETIFAIKRMNNENPGLIDRYKIVEVDINTGNELSIINEFDYSGLEIDILFLADSNELLIYLGLDLKRIQIDSKKESSIDNSSQFYSFRSVNKYN